MPHTDGPVTLLVVDDEEAIRNALRKYLALEGYEVVLAATGEEALAILHRQKITGILLDVNLPGTNGIDLVPRIMDLEPTAIHQRTPLVIGSRTEVAEFEQIQSRFKSATIF